MDKVVLDALANLKMRQFILRTELELLAFISAKNQLELSFPGLNPFQRLLLHRIADYFLLNHSTDMHKSVLLSKTSESRAPDLPLFQIAQTIKIMDSPKNNQINDNPKNTQNANQDIQQVINANQDVTTKNLHIANQEIQRPQFAVMKRSTNSLNHLDSSSCDNIQKKTPQFTLQKRNPSDSSLKLKPEKTGTLEKQLPKPTLISLEERTALYLEERAKLFDGTEEEEVEIDLYNDNDPTSKAEYRQFVPRPQPYDSYCNTINGSSKPASPFLGNKAIPMAYLNNQSSSVPVNNSNGYKRNHSIQADQATQNDSSGISDSGNQTSFEKPLQNNPPRKSKLNPNAANFEFYLKE